MKKKSYHLRVNDEDRARVAIVVERVNADRKARETAIPLPVVTEQSIALICFRLGLHRLEDAERITQEAYERAGKTRSHKSSS
jgi:hypothetical protein